MDQFVLGFVVFGLVACLFDDYSVQLDAPELYDDETYVHGELEEDQAYALGDELVGCGVEVYCYGSENGEAGNDEGADS